MQDAVAAARVACLNSSNLQGDDGRIQQRNNPAYRADEALGLTGTPVHILGPVETQDFFGQLGL